MNARILGGLSEISSQYDLIYCDVWGVVHNGREAFNGACEALSKFRRQGGVVVLVTNAPVPKHRVLGVMDRVGAPRDCFDDIASSGDATRREIEKHGQDPIYRIGHPEDLSLFEDMNVHFTTKPDPEALICCSSLRDFPDGVPETYREELQELLAVKMPMLCANPDVQFRHGDKLIWSAGALANMYEEMGGVVRRSGKPDELIYSYANDLAHPHVSRQVPQERILAIGDGLATDIRGANSLGVDSIFIAEGIHGHELNNPYALEHDAQLLMHEKGWAAQYIMQQLAW